MNILDESVFPARVYNGTLIQTVMLKMSGEAIIRRKKL